jgi:dTDP-L-rhamnose 4-epimerase
VSILVTGGAGFIGSHVVDLLLERGERVVVLDSLDKQVHPDGEWPQYLDARAVRVYGKVEDGDAIADILRWAVGTGDPIDRVIHLAAKVGVGQSAYEIAAYTEANATGTAVLLEALVEFGGIKRIVTAGSMSCYGEGRYRWTGPGGATRTGKGRIRTEDELAEKRWDAVLPAHANSLDGFGPIGTDESTPFVCTSVYAETKRVQEELTRLVGSQQGISWAVTRFFNVYGPRQSVSNPYTGVAAIFSSQIRSGRAPTIYEDGEQSRDFIEVSDIARAIVLLLDREDAVGVYNVGTGRRTSIRRLAEGLLDVYGRRDLGVEIRGSYRVGDVRHCFADVEKLSGLGWTAEVSLEDGLARLAEWVESTSVEDRTDRAHRELVERGLVR